MAAHALRIGFLGAYAATPAQQKGLNDFHLFASNDCPAGDRLLLRAAARRTPVQAADQAPYMRHETAHLTATVASVDPQQRTLVLVTPSGERSKFDVGPDVKNFDQIKSGDRVTLSYYVGVAFQLRPQGTSAQGAMSTQQLQTAPEGSRPGGALTRTFTTTVTVESIDSASNHITFKRADGTVQRVAVEDPRRNSAFASSSRATRCQ